MKRPSTSGSSAAMFLVDMYPDRGSLASETSDQMIRLNLSRILRARKCSSICPKKATKNSIEFLQAWRNWVAQGMVQWNGLFRLLRFSGITGQPR